MIFKFDEISTLKNFKSSYKGTFDYDNYFSTMDATEKEKEEKKTLAKKLEIVFLIMFALYVENEDDDEIFATAYESYLEETQKFLDVKQNSAYIEEHARKIILNVIETTNKNIEDTEDEEEETTKENDSYYLSYKRAKLIAANEATLLVNYREYIKAVKNGMTKKTWVTEKDKRVRKSHKEIDEETIDIFKPFEVGSYFMMFPKDTSLGADENETANCRCVAKYSK